MTDNGENQDWREDFHICRSWSPPDPFAPECGCHVLACGHVSQDDADIVGCSQHSRAAVMSLRSSHSEKNCPGGQFGRSGLMTPPFVILAPHLSAYETKLLRVCVERVGLAWSEPVDELPNSPRVPVLSCGKDALETWHDFGVIRVGTGRGSIYTTRDGRTIMVLAHPGLMAQRTMIGYGAREDMLVDLEVWREYLRAMEAGTKCDLRPSLCEPCLHGKSSRRMTAHHWPPELDGVGMCDDHYKRRGKYVKKETRVRVKDRGKSEHQMAGQMEAFPGDGTRLIVSKR